MAEGAPRRLVGQLDTRPRGRRTHLCCACDYPIAVYGRCAPCLHAYCLTCAASMTRCIICGAAITKLERIPAESGLYISPLTLQGYRTEADLAAHARKVHGQLQELLAAGEGGMGGGAGRGSMMVGVTGVGGMPGMAAMSGMPGMAGMSGMPGMAGMGAMVMPGMAGMQGMQGMPHFAQQQQQQRPPGWKPPPPPGAPPGGGTGYGGRGQQQQQPRHGQGGVMRSR